MGQNHWEIFRVRELTANDGLTLEEMTLGVGGCY